MVSEETPKAKLVAAAQCRPGPLLTVCFHRSESVLQTGWSFMLRAVVQAGRPLAQPR